MSENTPEEPKAEETAASPLEGQSEPEPSAAAAPAAKAGAAAAPQAKAAAAPEAEAKADDSGLPAPPPRKAGLNNAALWTRLLFLVVALILIVPVPYFWYQQNKDIIALQRHPLTSPGKLMQKLGGSAHPTQDIRYLYYVGKDRYSGMNTVNTADYKDLPVGSDLTIYYLKKDPTIHSLAAPPNILTTDGIYIAVWAVLVILILWLWSSSEAAWSKQLNLLRKGIAVSANVTELNKPDSVTCSFASGDGTETRDFKVTSGYFAGLSVGWNFVLIADPNDKANCRPLNAFTRAALVPAKRVYFWQRLAPGKK